jgi:hypothetical protein
LDTTQHRATGQLDSTAHRATPPRKWLRRLIRCVLFVRKEHTHVWVFSLSCGETYRCDEGRPSLKN